METALLLGRIAGPVYLLLGLSMLLYVKSWQHLYEKWAEDHFPLFTLMFVEAVLGLVVVNMYNVWTWNVWLLVTLTGWWLLAESVFFFLFPGIAIKQVLSLFKNQSLIYLCGLVCAVVGGVLGYYSYFA